MAKNLTISATVRVTDDNLLGTNNVGGDIQFSETHTISGEGYKSIAQASGAGAVQIFPPELAGSTVGFLVYAKYDSAEPAATKIFTLVEDSAGTPQTVVVAGPFGGISTGNDDITLQTGTANSVTFYIEYYVLA